MFNIVQYNLTLHNFWMMILKNVYCFQFHQMWQHTLTYIYILSYWYSYTHTYTHILSPASQWALLGGSTQRKHKDKGPSGQTSRISCWSARERTPGPPSWGFSILSSMSSCISSNLQNQDYRKFIEWKRQNKIVDLIWKYISDICSKNKHSHHVFL